MSIWSPFSDNRNPIQNLSISHPIIPSSTASTLPWNPLITWQNENTVICGFSEGIFAIDVRINLVGKGTMVIKAEDGKTLRSQGIICRVLLYASIAFTVMDD
jgi:hypothetical protein